MHGVFESLHHVMDKKKEKNKEKKRVSDLIERPRLVLVPWETKSHLVRNSNEKNRKQEIATNDNDANEQ